MIAGLPDESPLLDKSVLATGESCSENPPLFVVGSHVKKTTLQLEQLLQAEGTCAVEVDVQRILDDSEPLMQETLLTIQQITDEHLTPIVYTSRQEIRLEDADLRQQLGQKVSDFLVVIVRRLPYTPSYLVGKGGITSHDILTKGLGIRSARVMGPQFPYIIFPGNVGNDQSLCEVFEKLR